MLPLYNTSYQRSYDKYKSLFTPNIKLFDKTFKELTHNRYHKSNIVSVLLICNKYIEKYTIFNEQHFFTNLFNSSFLSPKILLHGRLFDTFICKQFFYYCVFNNHTRYIKKICKFMNESKMIPSYITLFLFSIRIYINRLKIYKIILKNYPNINTKFYGENLLEYHQKIKHNKMIKKIIKQYNKRKLPFKQYLSFNTLSKFKLFISFNLHKINIVYYDLYLNYQIMCYF